MQNLVKAVLGQTGAPKAAPTPAESAIASELQKVTRTTPGVILAPPVLAATPPRTARAARVASTKRTIRLRSGVSNATANGNAAPTEKLAADAHAACKGRAVDKSEIPNSSRACAPMASCFISCCAT